MKETEEGKCGKAESGGWEGGMSDDNLSGECGDESLKGENNVNDGGNADKRKMHLNNTSSLITNQTKHLSSTPQNFQKSSIHTTLSLNYTPPTLSKTHINSTKKAIYFCLACSIKCHEEGHEVESVGFKRGIVCDCGNSKCMWECKLTKEKEYENMGNVYNHNVWGRYCYCDKSDDAEETMVQCFICEDWFHEKCIQGYFGGKKSKKYCGGKESDGKDGIINVDEIKDIRSDSVNNNVIELSENTGTCENSDIPESDFICKNCVQFILPILNRLEENELKEILYGLKIEDKNEGNFHEEKEHKSVEKTSETTQLLGKKRKRSDEHSSNPSSNSQSPANSPSKSNADLASSSSFISTTHKLCLSRPEISNYSLKYSLSSREIFLNLTVLFPLLCHCETCSSFYQQRRLPFSDPNSLEKWQNRTAFGDLINSDDYKKTAISELEREINDPENDGLESAWKNFVGSSEFKCLPFEKQMVISYATKEFANQFKEFISNLDHKVITVSDVYDFFKKVRTVFEGFK